LDDDSKNWQFIPWDDLVLRFSRPAKTRRFRMRILSDRRWSLSILLALTMGGATFASGPIAVYALVDRVVFEPNETAPTRIQIWGTFAVAKARYSSSYSAAEKGYLYYKIDSAQNTEQATRIAWADLKKVAGTGEVVGFGGGYFTQEDVGKVRKATQKPSDPDVFPIGNPLTHLGTSQAYIVAQIKAAAQAK
jgi:hypothetical protein